MTITKPIKVQKSWGYELWIHNDSQYCGKLLVFTEKGYKFSMHYHMLKNETWYVQDGGFEFRWIETKTGQMRKEILNKGESVYIEKGKPHQLIALQENSIVFEVSTQHFDDDSYRIYKNTPNDLL
jgi:mannose-6-phosphate isomerase-like protein (cupin superfamily)